jgi:hypothetical protein
MGDQNLRGSLGIHMTRHAGVSRHACVSIILYIYISRRACVYLGAHVFSRRQVKRLGMNMYKYPCINISGKTVLCFPLSNKLRKPSSTSPLVHPITLVAGEGYLEP